MSSKHTFQVGEHVVIKDKLYRVTKIINSTNGSPPSITLSRINTYDEYINENDDNGFSTNDDSNYLIPSSNVLVNTSTNTRKRDENKELTIQHDKQSKLGTYKGPHQDYCDEFENPGLLFGKNKTYWNGQSFSANDQSCKPSIYKMRLHIYHPSYDPEEFYNLFSDLERYKDKKRQVWIMHKIQDFMVQTGRNVRGKDGHPLSAKRLLRLCLEQAHQIILMMFPANGWIANLFSPDMSFLNHRRLFYPGYWIVQMKNPFQVYSVFLSKSLQNFGGIQPCDPPSVKNTETPETEFRNCILINGERLRFKLGEKNNYSFFKSEPELIQKELMVREKELIQQFSSWLPQSYMDHFVNNNQDVEFFPNITKLQNTQNQQSFSQLHLLDIIVHNRQLCLALIHFVTIDKSSNQFLNIVKYSKNHFMLDMNKCRQIDNDRKLKIKNKLHQLYEDTDK